MSTIIEAPLEKLKRLAELQRQAQALNAERYYDDPVGWADGRLGEFLWSKQRDVARSVVEHRRTAVKSAHDTGKSFTASRLTAWWLDVHEPGSAFVVTTAPTAAQVRAILWREIGRAHRKGNLPGRCLQTEWQIGDELVAYGRKPADYDEEAFQGIHAEYVLVIIDEACHDDQTEVLTEHGWRFFADLNGSERLLTMDPSTHEATYRLPDRIVAKPYSGKMLLYEAKGANFCVTPDHEMYYHGRNGRAQDTAWRKAPASSLVGKTDKYFKKTICWTVPDVETHVIPEWKGERRTSPVRTVDMDDWLEFLGWYLSEGSLARDRKRRVVGVGISQRDLEALKEIYELCVRLDFPASHYPESGLVRIHSTQIGRHLESLGPNCLEKSIPDYARMVSTRQLNILLDAYVRGDGYRKGAGDIIYTSSPVMADDLQEIILKTGRPSVVRSRPLKGHVADFGTHTATSSVDGFVVTRPGQDSKAKFYPQNLREVDYTGQVYCATVSPEHLLFTRRKGYTMWSGNCGVPHQLWIAANSLAANENARILAIGNPDDPTSHFAKVCQPGSGWNVIHIAAKHSPNFTDEKVPDELRPLLISQTYLDEMAADVGEGSPIWTSKVEGEFPSDTTHGVVLASQLAVCRRGTERVETEPVELGVDVAGSEDGDVTVIRERRGWKAGQAWRLQSPESEVIAEEVRTRIIETGATKVKIDAIGIGWGVAGHLNDMAARGEHTAEIVKVNVGEASSNPKRYPKLRDQIWWEVGRLHTEQGTWDLSGIDDRTAADLLAPQWSPDAAGRIKVEPKDETRKRLGRSPDDGDALLLAFYAGRKGGRMRYRKT